MKAAYLFIFAALMGCSPAFAQTTVNNLKTNVLSLTKQGSTPSNAATGTLKLYGKSNDKLYTLTSGGSETEIGPMSFGAVGSSPSANGATVSGTTITLQPASGTQPGLMLAGSQTLGGAKTWNGGQNLASFLEFDSAAAPATTGDDVTLASPTKVTNVLADDALNSIAGITGPGNARMAFYVNSSGENITIRNNSGSASVGDKIITGTASDYTLADGSSVLMVYDTAVGVWRITGGPGPVTGVIPVANGGTGISSGTSGGIPYFSSSSTIASSAALTASQVMIGGGTGGAPSTITATTAGSYLRLNGSGVPAYNVYTTQNLTTTGSINNGVDRVFVQNTITATLPDAATNAGLIMAVIKADSDFDVITLARSGSDGIGYNGATYTSLTLNTIGETWLLTATSSGAWQVIGRVTNTPWVAFTPTLNSNTNVAGNQAWWRRVGDSIELRYATTYNGVGANSTYSASPPSGVTIDSAKLSVATTLGYGSAMWFDNGVGWFSGNVTLISSTSLSIQMNGSGTNFNTNTTANLDTISMNVTLPVSGWFN